MTVCENFGKASSLFLIGDLIVVSDLVERIASLASIRLVTRTMEPQSDCLLVTSKQTTVIPSQIPYPTEELRRNPGLLGPPERRSSRSGARRNRSW